MVSSRWKCRTGVTELSGSDWMARWSSSTLASGDNSGSEQGGTAGETHWSRLEGTLTWESLHDYGRTAAIPEGHENVDRALELAPCIEVGHQPLWPSPSSISACAVFSASSGPPVGAVRQGHRRHRASTPGGCSRAPPHGRVRYRPADRAVLEAPSLDPPKCPCWTDEVVVSGWRATCGVQILESPIKLGDCRSGRI